MSLRAKVGWSGRARRVNHRGFSPLLGLVTGLTSAAVEAADVEADDTEDEVKGGGGTNLEAEVV